MIENAPSSFIRSNILGLIMWMPLNAKGINFLLSFLEMIFSPVFMFSQPASKLFSSKEIRGSILVVEGVKNVGYDEIVRIRGPDG